MKKSTEISNLFEKSIRTIESSKNLNSDIATIVNKIVICFNHKKKIVIFGNGGSAADAQHMAAEFVGRYLLKRKSFPAISLTTDTSVITSIGNDFDFNSIFSRQCESIVNKGDIVIGISTSGNSENVIKGIIASKKQGAITIGITGGTGGKLKKMVDYVLISPSNETPHIQESHRVIIHTICNLVEKYAKK